MSEPIESAMDLLSEGTSAIVVFRHAREYADIDERLGSGYWKLNPERNPERVIIYLRLEREDSAENHVYAADYDGVTGPNDDGRFYVHIHDIEHVGTTKSNWSEFCGGGSNPVRYIP